MFFMIAFQSVLFRIISFKVIVQMRPTVCSHLWRPSLTMFCCFRYTLFAVVNHSGTLEVGHYTSFIRQQQQVRVLTGQCFISTLSDHLSARFGNNTDENNSYARTRFWPRIRNGKFLGVTGYLVCYLLATWGLKYTGFFRSFCAFVLLTEYTLFYIRMLFFRARLDILISLPILGWKYSCILKL